MNSEIFQSLTIVILKLFSALIYYSCNFKTYKLYSVYIIGSVVVYMLHFFSLKNDVEIPIPKFFINERYDVLKEREKLLGKILAKIGPQEKEDVSILLGVQIEF